MIKEPIFTNNEDETAAFAAQFSLQDTETNILFLNGDLGAGKTVFARNLIKKLVGDDDLDVPSPTFSLVQTYETNKGEIWHFDLYRLEDPEEIYELGWEEALHAHLIIVEWPERLKYLTPTEYLDIRITNVKDKPSNRKIEIEHIKT